MTEKDKMLAMLSQYFYNLRERIDMSKYYIEILNRDYTTFVNAKPFVAEEYIEVPYMYTLDKKSSVITMKHTPQYIYRDTYHAMIDNPAREDRTWLIDWIKDNPLLKGIQIEVKGEDNA